jgi:antitoxin ParD1/3/4
MLEGMAEVHISLPAGLGDWANKRVAEGPYDSASDYVGDLVRRDREAAEATARLQAAIDEGLASPETDTTIADIVAAARSGR